MCKRGNRNNRHKSNITGKWCVNIHNNYNDRFRIKAEARKPVDVSPVDIPESAWELTVTTKGEQTVNIETTTSEVTSPSPTPTNRRGWKIAAIIAGVGIGLLLFKNCKD